MTVISLTQTLVATSLALYNNISDIRLMAMEKGTTVWSLLLEEEQQEEEEEEDEEDDEEEEEEEEEEEDRLAISEFLVSLTLDSGAPCDTFVQWEQKTASQLSQKSSSCDGWIPHLGITSLRWRAIRSSSWLTRNDGGSAPTPPLGT